MKLLKGIFAVVMVVALIYLVIIAMMFDGNPGTSFIRTLKAAGIIFGIGLIAFIGYLTVERIEDTTTKNAHPDGNPK